MIQKITLFLLIFSFVFIKVKAQNKVEGLVMDSAGNRIPYVTIQLNYADGKFAEYTNSNEDGSYLIKTDKTGNFVLSFSAIGYDKKVTTLSLFDSNYFFDAILKLKITELDEVIVKSSRAIRIKKDTVVFNAESYLEGNEEVIEDLLKKIPGLNIDKNGTIKVGNQEVEKVMIDSDDFFERGYKVLTKNMPSQSIETVEVLRNYSNNRLLKDVEESDKVALNLKLKEDAKRIWFGNAKGGYDVTFNNRFEGKGNLMNFGKKNKFYFLTSLNNIGYDATGEINNLIRPYRYNEPASLGDDQSAENLIELNANPLNFKESRTNFNNAKLISLNAIFNPLDKVKIKTLAFFNWDENQFFRNRLDNVKVGGTEFVNTENYILSKTQKVMFGKVDVTSNLSKTEMIEATTKYNLNDGIDNGKLIFNDNPTTENLNSKSSLLDQKITYTNKLKERTTLLLTGRYIDEQINQDYHIDNYFFQDLFENIETVSNVSQSANNELKFIALEAHLLKRERKGNLMEWKVGNKWRRDRLRSNFTLLNDQITVSEPLGFQNDMIYQTNDLYIDGKYRYGVNNVALIGKLELHKLFNDLDSENLNKTQNPFFVIPSVGIDWNINDNNNIKTSYIYNTTNVDMIEVHDAFVLNNFRNFSKGTGNLNQLNASSFLLNYQFGNWSDYFFSNVFLMYLENHDFFSTNATLAPNYNLSQNFLIKDRSSISINTNLDYYFESLYSNLKVELGLSQTEFKNVVNNSDLREVTTKNYNYGVELRSSFDSFFNFNVGSKWTTNEIITTENSSFTDNIGFIDFSFIFSEKWDAQIQSERYLFGSLDIDNIYYFLDFKMRYQVKRNKLLFELNGKNLFDTKTFRNYSISDIGNSTTEYRLLPRFILLKMEYRF